MAIKEHAYSSLSSDFRTFGSTDPKRPDHRESGTPMTKPNGVEFRIFDHFPDKYIKQLVIFISLVAENSRVTKTKGYVYENKIWINETHNIMKNGYKAKISNEYINLLRKKIGIKIDTKSIIAIDIFKQIYQELWDKNIDGDWIKIFNCYKKLNYNEYVVPNINKKGWQFAFMILANREKSVLNNFNKLSKYLNENNSISLKDFKKDIINLFGKNWRDDIEDLAYFYESLKYIEIIKNEDYTIANLKIINNIPIIKNFNDYIILNFSDDIYLENVNNL
jgi:hypothetical protein